jgi:transketolase
VHKTAPDFLLGRALPLRAGDDVAILATGAILAEAVKAADLLAQQGIRATLLSVPTIQPLDTQAILAAAARVPLLVTVEEHRPVGGLASAVAETLACAPGQHARLLPCGVTISPKVIGGGAYLRERNGLDGAHLAQTIAQALAGERVAHVLQSGGA